MLKKAKRKSTRSLHTMATIYSRVSGVFILRTLICFTVLLLLVRLTVYSQNYLGHYDRILVDFEFKTLPFIELKKTKLLLNMIFIESCHAATFL